MGNLVDRIATWWVSTYNTNSNISNEPVISISSGMATLKATPHLIERRYPTGIMAEKATKVPLDSKVSGTTVAIKSTKLKNLDDLAVDINLDSLERMTETLAAREAKLVEDNRLWEATFNALPDLVILFGSNKKVLNVNVAFLTASGKTKSDFIGKNCHDIFSCPFCVDCTAEGCSAIKDNNSQVLVMDNFYLKGKYLFTANNVKGGGKNSYIVILKDIEKLKKMAKLASKPQ